KGFSKIKPFLNNRSDQTSGNTVELDPNTSEPIKKNQSKGLMIATGLIIVSAIVFFILPEETAETIPPVEVVVEEDINEESTLVENEEVIVAGEIDIESVTDNQINDLSEVFDNLKDGSQAPTLIALPMLENTIGGIESDQFSSDDELPQRLIKLEQRLAIGKTEVTVSQFMQFVNDTGYLTDAERQPNRGCRTFLQGWDWRPGLSWRNPGYEQTPAHPVVCVSWNDANAYADWLSEQTGKPYSLPSEAVWELAARAGTTTSRFWGDSRACDYANVSDFSRAAMHNLNITSENIFPCEDGNAYTAVVASYSVNQFGLHDMLGNVWEWTNDCWNENYLEINENGTARLTGNCNNRVYRGGSWGNLPSLVRSSKRLTDPMDYRYYNVGFRISKQIDS
ncbi:MAG: formylglycine-generating enzyme family protein, partial [Pseudomonadota bacterium]